MFKVSAFFILCLGVLAAVPQANAQSTSLPLPRYVSLRSADVNMRTGPGVRYPVEWNYKKAGLPVEIIAEFGNWRKIKDWDGTRGWVTKSLLSGNRTFRVLATSNLRRSPTEDSRLMARVESGVIGKLIQCPNDKPTFCRVEVKGYQGWLKRSEIWGVYPNEILE
ncbi:MAG: hypothetical protein IKD08_03575 [Alphaproteobacteria bacterium]|nr:hypothetical protein [Alphaproteobacteria bacterium]